MIPCACSGYEFVHFVHVQRRYAHVRRRCFRLALPIFMIYLLLSFQSILTFSASIWSDGLHQKNAKTKMKATVNITYNCVVCVRNAGLRSINQDVHDFSQIKANFPFNCDSFRWTALPRWRPV